MSSLKVNYKQIEKNNNEIKFDIIGDNKNGLDKTVINSLRKILLTKIETLAFDSEMIYMKKNTGSLHNEFLKDRLTLIPLYLNPDTFDNDYIFEINVKNTDSKTICFLMSFGVAPSALRIPISLVLSFTEISKIFPIPIMPARMVAIPIINEINDIPLAKFLILVNKAPRLKPPTACLSSG